LKEGWAMGRRRRNRRHEALTLNCYLDGDFSVEQAQDELGISRSTFFRRLRRYRSGGAAALGFPLRGKPSLRGQAYLPVKHQVLELYSYFYRQNRRRFVRPVAYSTVRKWLREAGLLRRPASAAARPDRQPFPSAQPKRSSRLSCGEIRERWKDIWRGWEKPGYGMWKPTRAERESWAQHVERLARGLPASALTG
jgi:transposase